MSEYQYVGFRAIDRPVSDKNLAYMERQSSRAEITPWSFDNEYHYGDFHGDAEEMLRRGYDIHLHYANFGIRKLMIRLPRGLPDASAARPYLDEDGIDFVKDKKGSGGILVVEPFHEPGDLDELWDLDELLDRLPPLRGEILEGDLRPLYLAHLAVICDMEHDPEESREGPVPAGLGKLTPAQRALAELYQLSDSLIAAAAKRSPPLPSKSDSQSQQVQWIQSLPVAKKDAWLARLLADPQAPVGAEMLEEFRHSVGTPAWPTVRADRTLAELEAAAQEISNQRKRKAAAQAARKREKMLAAMAADPAKYLRESEKLVAQRSTDAYKKAADLLADLREALAGGEQADLPERQAQKLRKENPTLKHLVSHLRRRGFLPK